MKKMRRLEVYLTGTAAVVVFFLCSVAAGQTGVCYKVSSRSVAYQCSYTEYYQRSSSYYYDCYWWTRRCTGTRYHSEARVVYRTCYRTEYYTEFVCCAGYQQVGYSCEPICIPECENGGTCVRPGTCQCSSEWTGARCTVESDVIGCSTDVGGLCHNDSRTTGELKVTINIQYTPPSDVSFRPPNYRPATPVTLTCEVEGANGTVSYQWTSTCSSCFVPGQTSHSVSRNSLFSIDAGVHTCTVTDGSGNSGNASTEMNIIGAGIYAYNSEGLNYISLPDNGVIVSQSCCQYFNFYCQSNSSSTNAGQLIGDYSSVPYTSYCGPGCYQVYAWSYWSSSYQGVYTCRIPDSTGTYMDVNVGLYPYGFNSPPSVTSFQHTSSYSHFTLSCYSTNSPATSVTWVKDDTNLTIDGSLYQLTQTVTYRRGSSYTNTLMSTDSLDNVVGNHTCIVSNIFGSSSQGIVIEGLQITGNERPLIIGESATLICSCDLDVSKIEWFAQHDETSTLLGTSPSQSLTLVFNQVSVEMHGALYACQVTSPYGTQERATTVVTEVPEGWSTIEVNGTTAHPTEGHDFGLICTVTMNVDLNADPTLEWLGPDGTPVLSEHNITVGTPMVDDNVTTLTLNFTPLNSSHGGEYTCKATISVSELNVTLSKTASRDLIVTSQALFQLSIGPVKHCIKWTATENIRIELAIKKVLIHAINQRCQCDFQWDAIDHGKFSCQTKMRNVIYRSKINGTSDIRTANEFLAYIEDWITSEGTFLLDDVFRLRVNTSCPLRIQSVHQPECLGDSSVSSSRFSMGKCFEQCVQD